MDARAQEIIDRRKKILDISLSIKTKVKQMNSIKVNPTIIKIR